MNFRLTSIAIVFLLVTAAPAGSQQAAQAPSIYTVELIIFRAATALGGAENWGAETATTGTGNGDEAASAGGQVGRFVQALPAAQFQLTALESKLKSTGAYVPVAHVAWSQTASAWGTHAGLSVQQLGIDVAGMTGTVSLERGQYLHLNLALSYAMANTPAGLGAGAGTTFTLNESRRIKYYERNYYDHPAFGVIALVTPAQGARPAGR